jgi:monofunctional biosynthetic peptidoglycan transglycosylase
MSAARARYSAQVHWGRIFRRFILTCVGLLLLPVPFILLFAFVQPPITAVMAQQTITRLVNGSNHVWPKHTTVGRDQISPHLRRAVLASEDDRFYLHYGIDFIEIDKALERRRQGGKLRGASTLTQQVAKNLFLWNGRSFIRKGLELYITVLLEVILTKDRILDLYLNLAEWGDGVYGAEAAARKHFGKSAKALTRDESARLAAILPSPKRWSPKGSIATQRSRTILSRMQYAVPKPAPTS